MKEFFIKWFLVSRFFSLTVTLSPIIVGLFLCPIKIDILLAICTVLSAFFIHITANLANDYFDYKSGVDFGAQDVAPRLVAEGFVSIKSIKKAILICSIIAVFFGFFLVVKGGLPIILIGLSGLFFAIAYTSFFLPCYKFCSEILVLFYFGPIASLGTFYLQTGELFNEKIFYGGLICGLFAVCILTVNNLRDFESDKKGGKITLIVRFGKTFGIFLYFFSSVIILILNRQISNNLLSMVALLPTCLIGFKLLKNKADKSYNQYIMIPAISILIYVIILCC